MNNIKQNNLVNKINSILPPILTPPTHEEELENQRIQIAWYIFLIVGIFCFVLAILFAWQKLWLHFVSVAVPLLASTISIILIKKGMVTQSITLLLTTSYTGVWVGIFFGKGLNDIAIQGLFPVIFMIGVLMNRRALLFFGATTIVGIMSLIYLESTGMFVDRANSFSTTGQGVATSILVLSALMIIGFSIQRTLLLNKKLNVAKLEAEQSNHLKSLFLANMSHELRTPLNAIIGYSEGILEEHEEMKILDSETAEDITRIQTSGRHLLTLINDLLDLSKIEADKMELYVEPFNLFQLVDEIINTVEPIAKRNNTRIELLNNFEDVVLNSDRQKVKQALMNLMSNAVKYTQNGKVTILVFMNDPSVIKIAISDTGIGISEDDLPYIFESFRQVDSSLSRNFTGTGLGLAITKRNVHMLNGDLSVESQEGLGSTFTLILPIKSEIESNKARSDLYPL